MTRLNIFKFSLSLCLFFIGFKGYSQIPYDPQLPQDGGQWSDIIEFDIVPVAIANLPDGRIVTWSSKYHDDFGGDDGYTYTQIFDPKGGEFGTGGVERRLVTDTNHDMFCPGINNLPDGRIMVTGGSSAEKTSIYDPRTNVWTAGDDLNIPRGYQGSVTLSDGSIFTIGGSWSGDTTFGGRDAELWTENSGWTRLTGLPGELLWNPTDSAGEAEGEYRLDNHAWLFAAPNGEIFHAGPGEDMHWIDVSGNGSYSSAGPNGKRLDDHMSMNGNATLFDIGKILKVGGSASYSSNTISNKKAYVIDINDADNVTVEATGPMAQGRIYVTSVVLPNGEVLVMGGMENAVVFSDKNPHLTAEMYNPVSNSFRTLAGMQVPRTYHSTGLLLPDGRVFMGGGGLCGEKCGVNHKDAEIFSPPYLFNSSGKLAARPTLNAPDKAYYGTTLPVTTSTANPEFSFIRFSSATHSVNNEQRRIPVTHTGSNGNYQLDIPNANLMPPGYYMLFVLDANGVPSIAETVWVGNEETKIAKDNLLVEFDFFEGSGSQVMDLSGNENHGTIIERNDDQEEIGLSREYWTQDGLSGNALEMDGYEHNSNTILEIPYSATLNDITDKITVMAWVNRNTESVVLEDGSKVPNVAIFSHDYMRSFFMGYHGPEFKVEFWTEGGGHFDGYTGKLYNPGQWEHFVSTYDGTTAKVYVNGIMIYDEPVSGDLKINASDNQTNNTFTLSGFYDIRTSGLPTYANYSGISDELDGRMDKFKLYNTALSEDDILSIYNNERKIVKNDNPCDDVSLAYEVNGKRDSGAKAMSLKEGDTLGFFLDKDGDNYDIASISGPNDQVLSSHIINEIQAGQSGIYKIKYELKETFLAEDLEIADYSSEMLMGPSTASLAINPDRNRFWSTQFIRGRKCYGEKVDGIAGPPCYESTHLALFPHHIDIKVSDEPTLISGLQYVPYNDTNPFRSGITNYEIYVSNSTEDWGDTPVKTGTWPYEAGLKEVTFPETEGKYIRLLARSSTQPINPETGMTQQTVTAALINIILTEVTYCEKELEVDVHIPKTFVYNNSWSADGDPSGASTKFDDIVIQSGEDAVFTDNTTFRNLTIHAGATLTLEEQRILTFNSITLNSSSTSYAGLIDNGWIAGDVTYNRFVNVMGTEAGGGNDLVSSPVSGSEFNAEFVANNPRLAEHPDIDGVYAFAPFNVGSGDYENFNIGTDRSGKVPIVSGVGYRMATTDANDENFKGTQVTFIGNITRNVVQVPLSSDAWNLIGNPYPAYLDFETFFKANKDQFDNGYQAIYGYTGVSNVWDILNSTKYGRLIAPGQGFFVKSRSGGGTVEFTPDMRRSGTSDDFIPGRPSNSSQALSKLKLNRGSNAVSTHIYFIEGTTKGLDPGYDAAAYGATAVDLSLFTNLLENNTGLDMAIQSLPHEDFNDVIVPLGIKAKAGRDLSISIDERSTLPSNIKVYLEDTQNKTLTLLNTDAYNFTPHVDLDSTGRFNVHYSARALSLGDLDKNDNLRIYTTTSPKTLFITGQLTGETTTHLYDIQGRLVVSEALNMNSTENTMDISTISAGVYVVKLNNDHQIKTQKVIIK